MRFLKKYDFYADYIKHQSLKTSDPKRIAKWKSRYNKMTNVFIERLKHIDIPKDSKILCLGARMGNEVDAFIKLGYNNTIGIDIVPPKDNPKVVKGDFNDLHYPDGLFNLLYTNSLDHSNNPEQFFRECRRVLVKDGLLIIDFRIGMDSDYEVIAFESVEDVVELAKGFKLVSVNDNLKRTYKKALEHQIILRRK